MHGRLRANSVNQSILKDLSLHLIEGMSLGLLIIDSTGIIIWANQYQADYTGINPENLVGKYLFDQEKFTSSGIHDVANLVSHATAKWQASNFTFHSESQQEEKFSIKIIPVVPDDQDKYIAILLGRSENLKDIKNINTDSLLQSVLSVVEDKILIIDKMFKIQHVSKSVLEFLSKKNKVVGQSCYKVISNKQEPCHHCPVSGLTGESKPFRQLHSDICRIALPIYDQDEKVSRFSVVLSPQDKDENAFKHHLCQVSALANFYRKIIDAVPSDIFVVNSDLEILTANKSSGRKNEIPPEEMVGKKLSNFHPFCENMDLIDNVRDFYNSNAPLDYKTNPIKQGKVNIRLLMTRIPEFEQLDASLIVADEIYDCNSLKQSDEKIKSIIDFSGRLAHDLINPMTSLLSTVDMLRNAEWGDYDVHRFKSELDIIQKSSERVQNILDKVRVLQENTAIDQKCSDPSKIIENAVLVVELQGSCKSIKIEKNIPENLPEMYSSESGLVSALREILLNAKESIESEGTVKINAGYDQILQKIFIQITDTGCGIEKEKLEKIIEPFYTTKPKHMGTGLGLFIAYVIITKHRGTLEFKSEPGKGTDVLISLPVV